MIKNALFDDCVRLSLNRIRRVADRKSLFVTTSESLRNLRDSAKIYFQRTSSQYLAVVQTPDREQVLSDVPLADSTSTEHSSGDDDDDDDESSVVPAADKVSISVVECKQAPSSIEPGDSMLLHIKDLNISIQGGEPLFEHGNTYIVTRRLLCCRFLSNCLVSSFTALNLSIHHGEVICLEGRSGVGKTKLLRALSQLDEPLCGTVAFTDPAITARFGPAWRRRVIFIPQSLPPLTGSPKDFILECCQFKSRQEAPLLAKLVKSKLSSL